MFQARFSSTLAGRLPRVAKASFHQTAPVHVKVGDSIPDLDALVENSPGNKVNLAKELTGKGVIIGVPAAFSPSCSANHLPSYINSPKLKSAGQVFVVSVNDPFVMKAWASSLDPTSKSDIRFLADPTARFTHSLDLAFDGAAIFGGHRSKRYALLVDNGKVKEAFVEPDNTGVDVSVAENVLG